MKIFKYRWKFISIE